MPIQERDKFLVIRLFPMMLNLITNIPPHGNYLRLTDAERSKSFLPRKFPIHSLVRPLRRIRFEQSQHVRNGNGGFELREQMNVVLDAAHL
jgi:hypothetical protein